MLKGKKFDAFTLTLEHRFFTRVRTISYRTKNNLYSIKVITHGYRGAGVLLFHVSTTN